MKSIDIKQFIDMKNNCNEAVILEFGPGESKFRDDAIGIDICQKPSVDYIADLSQGLHFLNDESVDIIHAYHFLEHVDNIQTFMSEIYRVLKKSGKLVGTVPHFSNPYFYSDYTHKSTWGLYTFAYFSNHTTFSRKVPTYYNNIAFEIRSIKIVFSSPFKVRNLLKKAFTHFFNLNHHLQEFYEENLVYIFPSYEISFELEKK